MRFVPGVSLTEPGSRVHIGQESVAVADDGSFTHEIQLTPGPNLVVIEAVDAAGNVSYQTQYVNAKFQQGNQ